MIKLNGKYLTTLLLVAVVSFVTMGAALSYNLSKQEGTKTLSLPPDEALHFESELQPPEVVSIKTIEGETRQAEGCVGNKIVSFYSDRLNGTTLYDLDNGEENLICLDNTILRNSGTVGMFSISQDKSKIILQDDNSSDLGEAFGVYVYDTNNESIVKIADISEEFNVRTTKSISESLSINYSTYN